MPRIMEIGGKRLPLLRWSFVRMLLGIRHLLSNWQVGDGREAALADYVLANAKPGDVDDAIRAVDEFCYGQSYMMNVGDKKGALLDAAIRRVDPFAVDLEHLDSGDSVNAPMHGKLVAVFVSPGDRVEKGQRLAVVEAMKMEHALLAPADGEVAEVAAEVGAQVAEGARLIVLKSDD